MTQRSAPKSVGALGTPLATVGLALSLLLFGAVAAAQSAEQTLQRPLWAYAVPDPPAAAAPAPPAGALYTLPGGSGSYTLPRVYGYGEFIPLGPVDWYPQDHPPPPPIVARGDRAGRMIAPCSLCHFANGRGLPENAPVAGQPRDYLVATLRDMRSGARKSAEPRKANAIQMAGYTKAMTDAEIEAAADYFASIPWAPWVSVVESRTAPRVINRIGLYLPVSGPGAGVEPLGNRIVEVPVDVERTERLRDWRSPLRAYVPVGSVDKGRRLVETGGGRTMPCAQCHGAALNGGGVVPAIASRSPSYIARQLNDFRQGTRNGPMATLMRPVVENLSDDDILNITAYLASRPVQARGHS